MHQLVKNNIMTKNTLETLIIKALKESKSSFRPDYPDVDKDGDTKEPMEKAFKDKKAKKSEAKNTSSTGCKKDSDCGNSRYDKCFKGTCMDTSHADKKIKEADISAGENNTMFNLKVDVSNKQSETKLGIRIQLTPKEGMLEPDVRDSLEATIMKKLNTSLGQYDIQVSKDTDVPDPTVIGFFIPLSQIKNMIVKSLGGNKKPQSATSPPTTPTAAPLSPTSSVVDDVEEMINEELIKEMRVRELKEISKTVRKEDFYEFINKGQNIIRTLEEAGIDNGKKYLEYLVKHNIM